MQIGRGSDGGLEEIVRNVSLKDDMRNVGKNNVIQTGGGSNSGERKRSDDCNTPESKELYVDRQQQQSNYKPTYR